MTSKAERQRRKRASRRIAAATSFEPAVPTSSVAHMALDGDCKRPALVSDGGRGGRTENQEAAWRWFFALREDLTNVGRRSAAARKMVAAIQLQLTGDEFSILCETCQPYPYIGQRVGRSNDTVRALEASALRKLVIYRSMNNIGAIDDLQG